MDTPIGNSDAHLPVPASKTLRSKQRGRRGDVKSKVPCQIKDFGFDLPQLPISPLLPGGSPYTRVRLNSSDV